MSKGISIDREITNFLQSNESTKTRFGALHYGVGVSDVADPWTRMSYAGANLLLLRLVIHMKFTKNYMVMVLNRKKFCRFLMKLKWILLKYPNNY